MEKLVRQGFASIKAGRPFVAWLKRESARRGVPMYELLELLVSRGGARPWMPVSGSGNGSIDGVEQVTLLNK